MIEFKIQKQHFGDIAFTTASISFDDTINCIISLTQCGAELQAKIQKVRARKDQYIRTAFAARSVHDWPPEQLWIEVLADVNANLWLIFEYPKSKLLSMGCFLGQVPKCNFYQFM